MKTLDGRITMGRVTSNQDGARFEIELIDEKSRCMVVDIELSPEQFFLAMTNMADVPCRFTLNDSGLVGKKREHKIVEVAIPIQSYNMTEPIARKAVKEFEVDGWKGRWRDCMNSHNKVRDSKQASDRTSVFRVVFERYVDE